MNQKCTLSDEAISAFYNEGYTMQQLADQAGVTRERIRQRLRRSGNDNHNWNRATRIDPIQGMRILRNAPSFSSAAQMAGCNIPAILQLAQELGCHGALKRLYRWRRRAAKRRDMVSRIQSVALIVGRTPTQLELDEARIFPVSIISYFGSLPAAMRAACLTPRKAGGRSHINYALDPVSE